MRISDWSSDVCSSDLQSAQLPAVEELVLAFLQVQHHGGAALGQVGSFQRVLAAAVAFPLNAFIGRGAGAAGEHGDAVGDHEGGEIGRSSCRERVCQYV